MELLIGFTIEERNKVSVLLAKERGTDRSNTSLANAVCAILKPSHSSDTINIPKKELYRLMFWADAGLRKHKGGSYWKDTPLIIKKYEKLLKKRIV